MKKKQDEGRKLAKGLSKLIYNPKTQRKRKRVSTRKIEDYYREVRRQALIKKLREQSVPKPPNYAKIQNERFELLKAKRRQDSRHHDLLQSHRDQMVKVPFDMFSDSFNPLNAPSIMEERPDSINILRRRQYNLLDYHPSTRLKFFKDTRGDTNGND